jgi:hypothetical protein
VGNVGKEWQKELQRYEEGRSKSPSLWWAFYRANRSEFWECGLLTLTEWSVMIIKPVLLFYFIEWLQVSIEGGVGQLCCFRTWSQQRPCNIEPNM